MLMFISSPFVLFLFKRGPLLHPSSRLFLCPLVTLLANATKWTSSSPTLTLHRALAVIKFMDLSEKIANTCDDFV